MHALKFQINPVLIRVDTKSGHGSGKTTKKVVSTTYNVAPWNAYVHCNTIISFL